MELIKDAFGVTIKDFDPDQYDYYDVNIGSDMLTAIISTTTDGIEVTNDLIPFPEDIDEADEGMKVFAMQLNIRPDDVNFSELPPLSTSVIEYLGLNLLELHIGFFEFDEEDASNLYDSDLLEEMEERIVTLRIGTVDQVAAAGNGTALHIIRTPMAVQLSDACIFRGGFEFPLNPSVKFVTTTINENAAGNELINWEDHEDLLTLRIWYKKVRRSAGIFSRILSLFRQNISA